MDFVKMQQAPQPNNFVQLEYNGGDMDYDVCKERNNGLKLQLVTTDDGEIAGEVPMGLMRCYFDDSMVHQQVNTERDRAWVRKANDNHPL